MKDLTNFAKVFGLNVTIMEGHGFKLAVQNRKITVQNPEALKQALLNDLQDDDARPYAIEIIDILLTETIC